LHFFPNRYPYQKPIIGLKNEIQNISFDDLRQFYRKFYSPANAILCIGGNINNKQTLNWIAKYFGSIPSEVSDKGYNEKFIFRDQDAKIMASVVSSPTVIFRFPSAKKYSKDFASMECLAYLLGNSESGYLKTTTNDNGFPNPIVFNASLKEAGYFSVIVSSRSNTPSAETTKNLLWSKIREFANTNYSSFAQQISEFKKKIRFKKYYEIQTIEGKMFNLYNYEVNLHSSNFFEREMSAYEKLNPQSILKTFRKYFIDSTHLFLTGGPTLESKTLEEYYTRFTDQKLNTARISLREDIPYNFDQDLDRSIVPPLKANAKVDPPQDKYWNFALNNGVKFIGLTNFSNPVVSVNIYFDRLSLEPESAFIPPARLFSEILRTCPTAHSSSDTWNKKLNAAAGYFYFGSEENTSFLQIKCLAKDINEVLLILKEKLLHPIIADSLLLTQQLKISKELSNWKENVAYLNTQLFTNISRGLRTVTGHNAIYNLEECRGIIKKAFSPENITVVINGDITRDKALKGLFFLNRLKNYKYRPDIEKEEKNLYVAPKHDIYFFNLPGAKQVFIKCGYIEQNRSETNNIGIRLVNYILGGYYSSRLNMNLREKQGITYKAFSYLQCRRKEIQFYVETSVNANSLLKAYLEINKELDSLNVNGVKEEELKFLKTAFSTSSPLLREFQYDKMKFMKLIADKQLPENINEVQRKFVEKVSLAELNEIARNYFSSEKTKFILIGDKKEILEQLKNVPLNLVEIPSD